MSGTGPVEMVRPSQTGRGLRAGQRCRKDSPETWEILFSTNLMELMVPGVQSGPGSLDESSSRESEHEDAGNKLELGSESISDSVFGTGSLSAFVVLMTPGNIAQTDPVEERGASLYQNRSWETRRNLEA